MMNRKTFKQRIEDFIFNDIANEVDMYFPDCDKPDYEKIKLLLASLKEDKQEILNLDIKKIILKELDTFTLTVERHLKELRKDNKKEI